MTSISPAKDLVLTRTFDAPRELVWLAFTDPAQLSQWFGPVGFSVPQDTVDIDLRVGGHWNFVMVSETNPEQTSPVKAKLVEVIENELLTGEELWEGPDEVMPKGTVLRVRMEFKDAGAGKTTLVMTQGPYDDSLKDMASEGWNSSFTKLDTLLSKG
ncbi:MAG: hypothetical protein JWN95_3256 [Frankiales bacterium]|nr:hypothetical protein [Frankiales bacterium]